MAQSLRVPGFVALVSKIAALCGFWVGMVVLLSVALGQPAFAAERTVSLQGHASLTLPNDRMSLRLLSTASKPTSAAAVASVAQSVENITRVLKELGIQNYSTEGYRLYPVYDTVLSVKGKKKQNRNVLVGYTASHSLKICLTGEAKRFGQVIDRLAPNAQISDLTFDSSLRTSETLNQARAQAFANAKLAATAYAQAAGCTLGDVVNIVDASEDVNRSLGGPRLFATAMNVEGTVATNLAPANSYLQADVQVTFALQTSAK